MISAPLRRPDSFATPFMHPILFSLSYCSHVPIAGPLSSLLRLLPVQTAPTVSTNIHPFPRFRNIPFCYPFSGIASSWTSSRVHGEDYLPVVPTYCPVQRPLQPIHPTHHLRPIVTNTITPFYLAPTFQCRFLSQTPSFPRALAHGSCNGSAAHISYSLLRDPPPSRLSRNTV